MGHGAAEECLDAHALRGGKEGGREGGGEAGRKEETNGWVDDET